MADSNLIVVVAARLKEDGSVETKMSFSGDMDFNTWHKLRSALRNQRNFQKMSNAIEQEIKKLNHPLRKP